MSTPSVVPARYYARLCDVLKNMDFDPKPVMTAADIASGTLDNPDGLLTMAQVEALLGAAQRTTGRSDLGLELANAIQLTSHSVVSYAMLSSPTLGYCLRLVARYFSLIMPAFRMDYSCDSQMHITVEPVWPMSHAALGFHLEVIAGCVYREARELLGGEPLRSRLQFSLERPPHAHRYDANRDLRTEFGWRARPGFRMELPAELATRPLAMADPQALRLAEQRCDQMLENARASGDVARWVHMMLRETSGEPPSLPELADRLHLSPRTLDRHLKKEDTSFRELTKRARRERACGLLRDGRLSVTQVAYELGYSDAANFARSFRRELGCSPAEWRAGQQTSSTAESR